MQLLFDEATSTPFFSFDDNVSMSSSNNSNNNAVGGGVFNASLTSSIVSSTSGSTSPTTTATSTTTTPADILTASFLLQQQNAINNNNNTQQQQQQQQLSASSAAAVDTAEAESHYSKLENIDLQDFVEQNNATLSFPEKLMIMLMHVDKCFPTHGEKMKLAPAGFLENGGAFFIRDKDELAANWLPLFFDKIKFSSFTRKLYRWGFKQVSILGTSLPYDTMFFHNNNFQRDRKGLLPRMRSVTALTRRKEEAAAKLRQEQQLRAVMMSTSCLLQQQQQDINKSQITNLTGDVVPYAAATAPQQQQQQQATSITAPATTTFDLSTSLRDLSELSVQGQQQQQACLPSVPPTMQLSLAQMAQLTASTTTNQQPLQVATNDSNQSMNQQQQELARALLIKEIARLQAEQEQLAKRENVQMAIMQMRNFQQRSSNNNNSGEQQQQQF